MDGSALDHALHVGRDHRAAPGADPTLQVLLPHPGWRGRAGGRGHRGSGAGGVRAGRRNFHLRCFPAAQDADGSMDQRRPRGHRLRRGIRRLRLCLPLHGAQRRQPRVPPLCGDAGGDVLLLHPRTLLLHPAGPRQARGPRRPDDPAVRDPRVPAHPDRRGGFGWRHHGPAAGRVDRRSRRIVRARAPHQADSGRGNRRRGAQQDRVAGADHHQQPDAGRRVHSTRKAGQPGARLGRLPDLPPAGGPAGAGLSRGAGLGGKGRSSIRQRRAARHRDSYRGAGRGDGLAARRADHGTQLPPR